MSFLRKALSNQRCQAKCQTQSGYENYEKQIRRKRHSRQRRGIVTSIVPHHRSIGQLHRNLSNLRQNHWKRQSQVLLIIIFIQSKRFHRPQRYYILRYTSLLSPIFGPSSKKNAPKAQKICPKHRYFRENLYIYIMVNTATARFTQKNPFRPCIAGCTYYIYNSSAK